MCPKTIFNTIRGSVSQQCYYTETTISGVDSYTENQHLFYPFTAVTLKLKQHFYDKCNSSSIKTLLFTKLHLQLLLYIFVCIYKSGFVTILSHLTIPALLESVHFISATTEPVILYAIVKTFRYLLQ